jgi:ABC-type transport system involved in cytochrome c biogenesis permease subunit
MVIQGRPPVTNLYSTAIFIGWTSVITCLFAERYFRNSLSLAVGSLIGLCTLIIAHYWSLDGDTLEMMQAVLDTNFWLATHVTSINFGYSATIVAGFMGVAYIILGLFTPRLANGAYVELGKATYGFICFAMFLSFIGTVLGGIWADQSWGRFWGWDTKENGALLIVLWNALILHSRWAGLVKQRGMAVLAVFGNIITAWSWVGTNQLGVGLHSYGSTNGVLMIMLAFDALMLIIMLMGLIPLHLWTSFRPSVPKTPNVQPPVGASMAQPVSV